MPRLRHSPKKKKNTHTRKLIALRIFSRTKLAGVVINQSSGDDTKNAFVIFLLAWIGPTVANVGADLCERAPAKEQELPSERARSAGVSVFVLAAM
jgi:hypothetical protein